MTLKETIKRNENIIKLVDSGNCGLLNQELVDCRKEKKAKKLNKYSLDEIKDGFLGENRNIESHIEATKKEIARLQKEIE